MTDQSSAIRLGLNISGKRWLELQAGTAQILSPVEEPRINYNIHEDFADARVICQQYPNANTRAFTTYLSDVQPYFANNGWGPYERDTSNGEQQAGDGKTIALNGKRYAKGLGVHSISDLQFDLTGKGCTRFQADVGIDQEIRSSLPSNNPGAAPNVIFAVTDYASGKVLTATYTGLNVSSPVVSLDVNVTGVNKLQLAMSTTKPKSARDWAWFTHADWANARVTCKQPLPIIP